MNKKRFRRVPIAERTRDAFGVVTRRLECGHEQIQAPGGKADRVDSAICKQCPGVNVNKGGFAATLKRIRGRE